MKRDDVSVQMSDAERRQLESSLRRGLRRAGVKPDSAGIRSSAREAQRRVNKK